MSYSLEERALIWLCACNDFDPRMRQALFSEAPSLEDLFSDFEKFFSKVILKRPDCVYKKGDRKAREQQLESYLEKMEKEGRFAVTAVSDDYPEALKATELFPLVLFGKGNRALLREKFFCIVGSRRTPPWAEAMGENIAETLSEHFAIVSGLAEGGDLAAMRGALKRGKAVCVLPCGLDECYPAVHISMKRRIEEGGLVLSECRDNERVGKFSFHYRNRILAGISKGTLVISAAKKSGALITAYDAVDLGRDVFAFPYNANAEQGAGCNDLIKKGAYLCTDAQDIFDAYGIASSRKQEFSEFSDAELKVISALVGKDAMHTAAIAENTGLPVYEVSALLSSLELKGAVVKAGANRYSLLIQPSA